MEITTKPLVMTSEVSGFEPLHGFIKQENKAVPVHFRFARKHGRQPEFIERKMPEIEHMPSLPTPTLRVEQSMSSAAVQAILPLLGMPVDQPTDRPTEKSKEAFVWDASKGIE